MPAANWPIAIVPGMRPGDPARFDPPNLPARGGDVVFWDNRTQEPHRIGVRDATGNWEPIPIGGDIRPGEQSDAWTLPAKPSETTGTLTITYGCLLHLNGGVVIEAGTIRI
jgi:hypothetical protein